MAASSPADLLAALARLMKEHPRFAVYLRTSRDAVLGAVSQDGAHAILLRAIREGASSYYDLQEVTGFSASYLHQHLKILAAEGHLEIRQTPGYGNKPRKLYFLRENIETLGTDNQD